MIVTEYKADDGKTTTSIASADTLKVILEAKLAMDYHIEGHKGGIATRVIAIAMNKKYVRVFLLEPQIEVTKSKPVKKHHNLFYVPEIRNLDSVDVSKLVSLMFFSYEREYWKLFNPKMQNREKKYKTKSVVIGTPNKPRSERQEMMRRDVSSKSSRDETPAPRTRRARTKQTERKHTSSNTNDSVIVFKKSTVIKETPWRRVINHKPVEVYALEQLSKFDQFVKLKSWSSCEQKYRITLERLQELNVQELETEALVTCMYQALQAIQHMHGCGIIHRDIKTSNCMQRIQKQAVQLVIIDFDLAVICEDSQSLPTVNLTRPGGTCGYIAPEMYTEEYYDSRVDIFSCGIMFAEWYTGTLYHKFGRDSLSRVMQDLSGEGMHHEIKELIQGMVCENRDNRISVEDALAHPLFMSK
jgi:hypothetical protein